MFPLSSLEILSLGGESSSLLISPPPFLFLAKSPGLYRLVLLSALKVVTRRDSVLWLPWVLMLDGVIPLMSSVVDVPPFCSSLL